MKRITSSDVRHYRKLALKEQNFICPLCEKTIEESEAVLDHDHKTGECRAAVHRGCNVLLGKIENNVAMAKLKDVADLATFLRNLEGYRENQKLGYLHPTHYTEAEKKERARKRARKKRLEQKKKEKESG
jgi:hypothetical protein